MTIPGQMPLREWESATSWDDVFSGCGVLTPHAQWAMQPSQPGDPDRSQRWESSDGALFICPGVSAGTDRVVEGSTQWLAMSEEAQRVHRVSKIDVVAHVCAVSVARAATALDVFIDPFGVYMDIWTHPQLRSITRYSLGKGISPHGVLGAVAAIVLANTSPHLYLTGRRRASLNLALCGISRSSGGKGTTAELAKDLVQIATIAPRARTVSLKSVEGAQKRMAIQEPTVEDEEGNAPAGAGTPLEGADDDSETETDASESVLGLDVAPIIYEGETAQRMYDLVDANRWSTRVDELVAFLKDRNGGKRGLQPLAAMMSGENVGADLVSESRTVPEHGYRWALMTYAQPLLIADLLSDTEGGVAQRFVWLPINDLEELHVAQAVKVLGPLPSEDDTPKAREKFVLGDAICAARGPVTPCTEVSREVARRRALRPKYLARTYQHDVAEGDTDEGGHVDLTTLKLHTAISAMLYEELRSTVEAWVIADIIMQASEWVRESTLAGVAQRTRAQSVDVASKQLETREAAEAALESGRIARSKDRARKKIGAAWASGRPIFSNDIVQSVNSRSRPAMRAALAEDEAEGVITVTRVTNDNGSVTEQLTPGPSWEEVRRGI